MFSRVIVVRRLTAEEEAARQRRRSIFVLLACIVFFTVAVHSVLGSYKEINFPHWFRFLLLTTLPIFLTWALLRIYKQLLWVIGGYIALSLALDIVKWAWHASGV